MNTPPSPLNPVHNPQRSLGSLQQRVDELRSRLREIDADGLARRCGAGLRLQAGSSPLIELPVWERMIEIQLPEFKMRDALSQEDLSLTVQALILYHLSTTDGSPLDGKWISFSELPDGRFYNQAFQGYTGGELSRHFGEALERYEAAAEKIGGRRVSLGDSAFAFKLLPRLDLAVVSWRGDEDFPATYQLLFDAAASHHLPTDACAIAGSMLTRRLMSAL